MATGLSLPSERHVHRRGFRPNKQSILTLGDVLHAVGLDPAEVLVIRHTYRPGGLASRPEASPEVVLAYARVQLLKTGKSQPTRPGGS